MNNELKLRVVFDMVDRLTRPLRQTLAGSKSLSRALADTKKQLSELQKQQKTVDAVKAVRTEMGQTATKLKAAQERFVGLQAQIQATTNPTVRMQNAMRRASASVVTLTQQQERQRNRLGELNARMQQAGRGTQTLTAYEKSLQSSIAKTNETIAEQGRRLQAVHGRRAALAPARDRLQAARGAAAEMAVGGYASRAVGGRVLGGVGAVLDESKHAKLEEVRIQALGAGDHDTKKAIDFARKHKSYGVSTTENLTLMRDAMTILNDEHHAEMILPTLSKMKFANDSLFGAEQGGDNEQKFINMLKAIEQRGGTNDAATFNREANMVQKVITATGGRVGGDQWQEFIKTGGTAAKMLRSDAFYYQMEPLIQEMGGDTVGSALMSGYQNLIEGRTTVRATRKLMSLGLLNRKKVEFDKIGRVKAFADGALLNTDQFKSSPFEWLEKTLLPLFEKKGITSDRDVLSAISSIFTNRRASNLFATMFLQRKAIHKSVALNEHAYDIDQGFNVGQTLPQGKEIDALSKKAILEEQLGSKILPLYNRGLELTANLIERVSGWTERNAGTARALAIGLAALGAVLVVGGSLTIGLAAIIGPLALTRYGMAMLGVQGGLLRGTLGILGGAFRLFGTVLSTVGRMLLLTPIGLAITGIALAAFLLIRYWEPIKAFFAGLWAEVKTAFDGGIGAIAALILNWSPVGLFYRAFAAVMSWFGVELPAKFTEFGGNMVTGLVNGITGGFSSVKSAITSLGDSAVGWFKEKLGIHSPSRVFAALGGFIGQGAAQGIEGERASVAGSAARLAGAASLTFGALTANAAPSPLEMRPLIDTRPPLSAASAAPSAPVDGGVRNYYITIKVENGDNMNEFEAAVRRVIEQVEREDRRRVSSRLSD
ncbi:phage tail tape measure protein [Burkholderia pyrrocinia]